MAVLSLNLLNNEIFITALLFINALTGAFIDVVVDALMVIQSRRDLERGSEDLQTLSWALLAFGGICGSFVSAFFTEYLPPRYTFMFCSVFGIVIAFVGMRISNGVERSHTSNEGEIEEEEIETIGFCAQFQKNMREIKVAL